MDSVSGERWWRRLFRGRQLASLDPDRPDLVVVASSFDDAEACSAALDRAESTDPRWTASDEVVFRHHLSIPAGEVADAIAVAGQDGYGPVDTDPPVSAPIPDVSVSDARPLVLQRVQVLDALHCSQERSRMAGLAQRRGGAVLGWEALQPAISPGAEQDDRTG